MRRKQPASDPYVVTLVVALVMIAIFLALVYLRLTGPNSILPIIQAALTALEPSPTPPTANAELAVRTMYEAMADDAADASYLNVIAPASREKIRVENVLRELLEHSKFEAYNVKVPLGFLTEVKYHDMRYSGNLLPDGHVLVTANGRIEIKVLRVEYPVCDQWDVRTYGDKWLVDVDAPERSERQQRIAAARLQDDTFLQSLPLNLGMLFEPWSEGIETGIKKILYMCE